MTATLTDGLTVTRADRVTDIGRASWHAITSGASLYSSFDWLDYVEHYEDSEPRYLLVHRGDRLVGALPAYRFPADMPSFYSPERLVPGTEPIRPVLLGGTRMGYVTEFLLSHDLDRTARSATVRLLLDRLRAEPAGLAAMLYLTDEALDLAWPHLAEDDQVLMLDARARLAVDRTGLAGYAVGGNRKQRRRRARMQAEMQRLRDAGCHVESLRLSACHRQLGHLGAQVLRRYGQDITARTVAERMAVQASTLDDTCRVLVARQGERIVGFTQFFAWENVLYARLHGVDDTIARVASLYFNLTYYHAIEYAAANGYTAIDLGCDSYDAKVQRGANLEPLWGLVLRPRWEPPVVDRARRSSLSTLDKLAAWDPAVRTPTAQRVRAGLTPTGFPVPHAPGAGSAAGTRPPRA